MSRSVLALLLAALIAAAPAHAQVEEVTPLSQDPPVALGDDSARDGEDTARDGDADELEEDVEEDAEEGTSEDGAAAELPDTGAEPLVLLLLGVACVSGGAGLRLRLGRA